jgi:VWFA-related protein
MGSDDRDIALNPASCGDKNIVRITSTFLLPAGAVAALCGWAVSGQIKVDVQVVNVLCTVYDGRGALVKDLDKDAFEIREDGRPQQIRYFARETDLPLTLALLLDVSGSVRKFLQSEKDTAVQFLRAVIRPQDQAMITGFSSTVVVWRDFTPSIALLGDALQAMHAVPFKGLPKDGGPMPTTLLYDALSSSAVNKMANVPGRKAMVIISDGVDIGSRTNLEFAVRETQTANAIIYSICYPNEHQPGCGYLKSLSEPTGGRMFELGTKTSLDAIFRTIEAELRSQYSLGFVSDNQARDGSFRKLQVRVNTKGMRVVSRKGYYVEK